MPDHIRTHHPRDYPDGAVVAVVYHEQRFLTIKRSQFVKAPGAICFAGGGVEPDEQPEDAIVREMWEELNVHVKTLGHVWTGSTPSGIELGFWQVHIEPGQTIVPNPAEVEAYYWHHPNDLRRVPGLLDSAVQFLDHWDAGNIRLA